MPGRNFTAGSGYRYGFNWKEKSNEVYGDGNIYDYGFRIYNSRLGKFLSIDPLSKKYPWYTPYQFAGNTPIQAVDMDGLEEVHYWFVWVKNNSGKVIPLKVMSEMEGTPTGEVDRNGVATYKEPYKIYAHTPVSAFGIQRFVSATYNSEQEFANAKYSDFNASSILQGMDAGAEIGMKFGDMLAFTAIATTVANLSREAISLYIEQKVAQYSVNMVNSEALQQLFRLNVKNQILKSGITAEAKLAAIEAGTVDAHFLSRHGAQTTLQQQLVRSTTGVTPDGVAGRAVASSRFLTHDFELEALQKAESAYTPNMAGKGTVIDMGKVVGEGYLKGGGAVRTSSLVQVYYNLNGEVITMFPIVPK